MGKQWWLLCMFSSAACGMYMETYKPKTSFAETVASHNWQVKVLEEEEEWQVTPPNSQTTYTFSFEQIGSIIRTMPSCQKEVVLAGDILDSVAEIINALIHQKNQEFISGFSAPQTLSLPTMPLLSSMYNAPSPPASSSSFKSNSTEIMNRMKTLAHTMRNGYVVPRVHIHQKCFEYKQLQMQGDVKKLEHEVQEIEKELHGVPDIFKKTVFCGWTKQMSHQLLIVKSLLQKPITKQLNTVRTQSLNDAKEVIKQVQKQWPYSVDRISTTKEDAEIKGYLSNVGFNELKAATNILEKRPDYHRDCADRLYNGQAVSEREKDLAQKAYQQPNYQGQMKQRESLIQHLGENPDLLNSYQDYLMKNPGIMQRISPNEGVPQTEGEFNQWCKKQQQAAKQEIEPAQVLRQEGFINLEHGVQPYILEVVKKSKDQTTLVQGLEKAVDAIEHDAAIYNCVVHPDVSNCLHNSLGRLSTTKDQNEFKFHLAFFEHALDMIKMRTDIVAKRERTLLERSPDLLMRAAKQFFNDATSITETDWLIADMARYVCDVTFGTKLLPEEMREQRIAKFWEKMGNLSFENVSNMTAEQFVDGTMYIAARAAWFMPGLKTAASVARNLKTVADTFEGMQSSIAKRFNEQLERTIKDNPILINGDGTVNLNPSKEALSQARQLILAHEGSKDKNKDFPKIIDDAEKVEQRVKKFEKSEKALDDLIKRAKPGRQTSRRKNVQYEMRGNFKKAMEDFESLKPEEVRDISDMKGSKTMGFLEDGRTAIVRETSKGQGGQSGPPTLEIQNPNGSTTKFRYLSE